LRRCSRLRGNDKKDGGWEMEDGRCSRLRGNDKKDGRWEMGDSYGMTIVKVIPLE
jgi:hypothetical protein